GECANACGYTDEASAMLEEALARNQGLPGVGRQSLLVSRLALVRLRQGRPTEALELAEQAVALARRQSWGFMAAMALHSRGRTLVAIGRPGEAAADFEAAVEKLDSAGMRAVAATIRNELDGIPTSANG